MDKKTLRKEIIDIRNKMDIDKKELADKIIKEKLMKTSEYIHSKNIFIYLGYGSEINTIEYVKEFLKDGKNIYIPRTDIENKLMEAIKITSLDGLTKDKYGILEPDMSLEAMNKNELDLIIMPGVAFDAKGGRLGYGGGYYDKYLKSIADKSIPKIALAYDFQIIEEVPKEEHDIMVDYIITEKREMH